MTSADPILPRIVLDEVDRRITAEQCYCCASADKSTALFYDVDINGRRWTTVQIAIRDGSLHIAHSRETGKFDRPVGSFALNDPSCIDQCVDLTVSVIKAWYER